MVDGVLYVTTPYNNIAALDAETGKELWRFDSEAVQLGGIPGSGFKHRAPALWRDAQDGNKLRVFLNTRNRLFSLDAEDRQAGRLVRQQRRGVAHRRLPAADFRHPARQPRRVAAGRLPRPRHRGQPDSRSVPADQRASGHRAGIRRAHREAAVGVERHSAVAERLRRRDVGRGIVAVQRPRQRLGADGARRGARSRLLRHQHAQQRLLRRPAAAARTCPPSRSSASTPPPASASGTSRRCITACGTTTTRRRPIW